MGMKSFQLQFQLIWAVQAQNPRCRHLGISERIVIISI